MRNPGDDPDASDDRLGGERPGWHRVPAPNRHAAFSREGLQVPASVCRTGTRCLSSSTYDLTGRAAPTPWALKSRDCRSRGGRRSSGTTALTSVARASQFHAAVSLAFASFYPTPLRPPTVDRKSVV